MTAPNAVRTVSPRQGQQHHAPLACAVARFLVAYSVIPVAVPAASLPLGPPKSTPNCFVARDASRQQLAYVYYENELL